MTRTVRVFGMLVLVWTLAPLGACDGGDDGDGGGDTDAGLIETDAGDAGVAADASGGADAVVAADVGSGPDAGSDDVGDGPLAPLSGHISLDGGEAVSFARSDCYFNTINTLELSAATADGLSFSARLIVPEHPTEDAVYPLPDQVNPSYQSTASFRTAEGEPLYQIESGELISEVRSDSSIVFRMTGATFKANGTLTVDAELFCKRQNPGQVTWTPPSGAPVTCTIPWRTLAVGGDGRGHVGTDSSCSDGKRRYVVIGVAGLGADGEIPEGSYSVNPDYDSRKPGEIGIMMGSAPPPAAVSGTVIVSHPWPDEFRLDFDALPTEIQGSPAGTFSGFVTIAR